MSAGVVAFIHAKGRSERVPSKNLRILGDRPLFCHAIANALRANHVDRVVVDSDSPEILKIGCNHGATALARPEALATNRTSGDELARWQAENYPHARIVVQVVPTAPFLEPASIDRAIEMLERGPWESVVGVRSEVVYRWEEGRPAYFYEDGRIPNSFEMEPLVFETTGLYANRTEMVLRLGKRLNPARCAPLHLSRIEAIDIKTIEDFEFAETVWQGLRERTARVRAA